MYPATIIFDPLFGIFNKMPGVSKKNIIVIATIFTVFIFLYILQLFFSLEKCIQCPYFIFFIINAG